MIKEAGKFNFAISLKKGKKMSENTKAQLEAKILHLQNFLGDVQNGLNHEKKERETNEG